MVKSKFNFKSLFLIIFIYLFLNFIIYYLGIGFINVNASSLNPRIYSYSFRNYFSSSPSDTVQGSSTYSTFKFNKFENNDIFSYRLFYTFSEDLTDKLTSPSVSFYYNFTSDSVFKTLSDDDLIYFKFIIKITSYYDINIDDYLDWHYILNNYSNSLIGILGEDIYIHSVDLLDYNSYITIDNDSDYAYNQLFLISGYTDIDLISTQSNTFELRFDGVGGQCTGYYCTINHADDEFGFVPYSSKNYIEINNYKFSTDDDILLTLDDYVDFDNLYHYDSSAISFPDNSKKDNFIVSTINNVIKNIGLSIKNFTLKMWYSIKDFFIRLVVPSDDYFKTNYTTLKDLFNEKFSLFIKPLNIFINFIEKFANLLNSDVNNFVINVPDIKIPFFNEPIIKATSYDLSNVLNHEYIYSLWILYLDFVDVFLFVSFLNFSYNKLMSFVGGMTSDSDFYSVDDIETYDKNSGKILSHQERRRTSHQIRRRNY